ncbi:MAG: hypothetical protein LBH24_03475 [Clostridiales bacterium]|jgi:hypothetical protein|nr:hypothetical protein [Clostridiales bacterium]
MGKYDGIDVAEVTLIDNQRRRTTRGGAYSRRGGGYGGTGYGGAGYQKTDPPRRGLLVRLGIAGLIAFTVFAGRLFKLPVFEAVGGLVKNAILYDMSLAREGEAPGEGVIVAYFTEQPGADGA